MATCVTARLARPAQNRQPLKVGNAKTTPNTPAVYKTPDNVIVIGQSLTLLRVMLLAGT